MKQVLKLIVSKLASSAPKHSNRDSRDSHVKRPALTNQSNQHHEIDDAENVNPMTPPPSQQNMSSLDDSNSATSSSDASEDEAERYTQGNLV